MPTRVLFENHRVRVSNFVLPSGETARCEHGVPTVRWQVGKALHQIDGGAPTAAEDKDVSWCAAGTSFDLSNRCSINSRQVLFELLGPPRYTEAEVNDLLGRAVYSTDVGTSLLLENEYVRVWDFYLAPGEGDPRTNAHHHVLDYVFVYVAQGRLLGYHPGGEPGLFDSVNDDGDVTWFDIPPSAPEDASYAHAGKNGYDDRPMREYLVELK